MTRLGALLVDRGIFVLYSYLQLFAFKIEDTGANGWAAVLEGRERECYLRAQVIALFSLSESLKSLGSLIWGNFVKSVMSREVHGTTSWQRRAFSGVQGCGRVTAETSFKEKVAAAAMKNVALDMATILNVL